MSKKRLYGLDAWREAPYYSERERAALEWTEALTNIKDGHAPDRVCQHISEHAVRQDLLRMLNLRRQSGVCYCFWNTVLID